MHGPVTTEQHEFSVLSIKLQRMELSTQQNGNMMKRVTIRHDLELCLVKKQEGVPKMFGISTSKRCEMA